jgi:hypothetical protein
MSRSLRLAPDGSLAVHAPKLSQAGRGFPWVVVWVEPGCMSHWPSQGLSEEAVVGWQVLSVNEVKEPA